MASMSLEQLSSANTMEFPQLENNKSIMILLFSAILINRSLFKKTRLLLSIVSMIFDE